MVDNDKHDGPATHAVTFVWNGQEVIHGYHSYQRCKSMTLSFVSLDARSRWGLC